MKTIITTVLIMVTFGFAKPIKKTTCQKSFKKESKRKKKSTFEGNKGFETKNVLIDNSHARKVFVSFSYNNNQEEIVITSIYVKTSLSLKRKFRFNDNTILAFVYEDGTAENIEFKGGENETFESDSYTTSKSRVNIDKEELERLSFNTIKSIEILNPYGSAVRSGQIHEREISSKASRYINLYGSCFINRI